MLGLRVSGVKDNERDNDDDVRAHVSFDREQVPYRPSGSRGRALTRDVAQDKVGSMLELEILLEGLAIGVEPFAVCELRGTGRIDLGHYERATLHYTLAGSGTLQIGDGTPIPVARNTVIIVPANKAHRLEVARSGGAAPRDTLPHCAPLQDGWRRVSAGDGGTRGVLMACGVLDATYRGGPGLFDFLDRPIIESLSADDPICVALDTLLGELAAPGAGARALAAALMQQCLVLLLRRQWASDDRRPAWLDVLGDPRLGAAVRAILDRPGAAHTLESLAGLAGMSRSTFAARFAAVFHRGPRDFLREVRLKQAARLLGATTQPVKQLAAHVGYDSRSYFSRAFKAHFGVSPAVYRSDRIAERAVSD